MCKPYIQVILLCLPSDEGVCQYFEKNKEEIDAVTKDDLFVVVTATVQAGDPRDVASAVDSSRYPGLTYSDIPCLWVEKPHQGHFVIHLPDDTRKIRRIIRKLTDCAKQKMSLKTMEEEIEAMNTDNGPPPVPAWFAKAGYVALVITLLFFMAITVAAVLGKPVPDNSRMLVVFIFAISVAAAMTFLGGSAIAKGSIPLPFVQENPIKFTVGGGIAAVLILLLIGYYVYGKV